MMRVENWLSYGASGSLPVEGWLLVVQITEVVRRAEQGVTRPFICRDDEGVTYFVKGIGAGRKSQLSEWLCGKFAEAIGLPVAPFKIVEVPEELLEFDNGMDLSDLGSGPVFASEKQEVIELTGAAIDEIPDEVQRDVLVFDWWVRNSDRMFSTENGGNPNLFLRPRSHELVVIDHNQAFDEDFSPEEFLEYHIFAHQAEGVFGDMFRRDAYNSRFASILDQWDVIRRTVPPEWGYTDPEMTVPVSFGLEDAYRVLSQHDQVGFWDR
ncbi:HipA family kinase [Guyparkeria halophila]|uniref:HipA family kinase n=1 Tax=Guyparkeria halophila TaxID=47960 RepID=A0ABZ0YZQ2_9GAMM|nr:HipA family kinase [Guyparkeria halophila]WQH17004.1 HipA family kinase [Guyparkeria halophila]